VTHDEVLTVLRERVDALVQKVAGHELRLDALDAKTIDPLDAIPRRGNSRYVEAFLRSASGTRSTLHARVRAGVQAVVDLVRYEALRAHEDAMGPLGHVGVELERGQREVVAGRLDDLHKRLVRLGS
jgi:hypothetical protein